MPHSKVREGIIPYGMPFETLEDIIRALEQHPEWRQPLLRVLELDRLRTLPDQVAELRADAIFTAVRATTREPLYLVLEVSYVVDRADVSRAIQRARVFQERGFKAVPAVAGEQATKGAKSAAERGEVLLALDGAVLGEAFFERSL